MKPALKRIEATLHQLPRVSNLSYPKPANTQMNRTYSFEISGEAQKRTPPVQQQSLIEKSVYREPKLPDFKPSTNVSTVLKVLKETPDTHEVQLEKVVRQIQDLYLEGPIVDGWLESSRAAQPAVERMIDYGAEVYRIPQGKVTCELPRLSYRLCGFDTSGQKWSRPCPMEQLASVSVAISRYQRLRQLLERKQYLEKLMTNS